MKTPISIRLAVVAAVVGVSLSACGSDSDETQPGTTATRTVESTFTGKKVEIPIEPKRVVALWRTGSELADLGVTPVGALQEEFFEEEIGAQAFAKVKDVATVGSTDGVDVEKVITLKPDLIIGMDNGGLTIDYAELAEVAPTVILKIAEPTDVWANYPRVADLVGKKTDFAAQDKALDDQLAEVKAEFGDKVGDLQSTSIGAYDGTIYVETSKSLTYERITGAGFGYSAKYADDPQRYSEELSTENIASLADQDIIFYDAGIDGAATEGTAQILELASFKRLPAVKAGNVFPLTSGTIYTFVAAKRQVEELRTAAKTYTPVS